MSPICRVFVKQRGRGQTGGGTTSIVLVDERSASSTSGTARLEILVVEWFVAVVSLGESN